MTPVLQKQLEVKKTNSETKQWDFPPGFNLHPSSKSKPKPEGAITYSTLRNFSVHYPVARACIDYLKTKITKLDWAITPIDEEDDIDKNDGRVMALEEFFKHPMGQRSNFRDYIDAILEDYLVIGSFASEKAKTRGGMFLGELKLVDSATIRIVVDETGRIPEPPDTAYIQVIRGQKVADLTQDELLFVNRNTRTNTVFGLSPIESIIIQADSAIKSSLYNRSWFSDGNLPEGFGELPEDWSQKQIKEFQTYFDSILSGNPKMQRRIKMVPKGFKYSPIKKPDDIGYEKQELWLLQQTCSVFGVPPQDIGYTYQVNKATGEVQSEKGQERGMRPLVDMLQQVFSDLIQNDFAYPDLEFTFTDVDPSDKKAEAEIDKIRLESGVISGDEVRAREGLEPIGLKHYVNGSVTFIDDLGKQTEKKPEVEDEDREKHQLNDLHKWRSSSLTSLKRGKSFKKFESKYLDKWMVDEIYPKLLVCKNKDQVKLVFDPYLNGKIQTVKKLSGLLNEIIKDN